MTGIVSSAIRHRTAQYVWRISRLGSEKHVLAFAILANPRSTSERRTVLLCGHNGVYAAEAAINVYFRRASARSTSIVVPVSRPPVRSQANQDDSHPGSANYCLNPVYNRDTLAFKLVLGESGRLV